MWVTQTYLANVEPNAQLYVYYLFEDYDREQKAFTDRIQRELEDLGEIHGDSVSLLIPNKRFTAQIESEVRGIHDFWDTLRGKLPGLLISSEPLSRFDPKKGEYYLVQFQSKNASGAARAILELRRLINEQLAYQFANQPQKKDESLWQRVINALEMKPGVFGFRLDLKRLFKRL